ncbi:Ig-like domain-containing protein [Pseudoalteromonas sp. APC 3358]|nr:Ig-like domain-containing protein [Pseudoalteromonas sp. APC 3358]
MTTISADGTWSIEISTALSEGDFTVTANVSDNAGNAAQDSQLGTVDTTPPLVAINDFADSNDTTPIFSGTTSDVAPGSLVSVLVTDANGESQTLTAVVSEDGTWQVGATQAVAEGDFTITATVTDAAGNEASDTGTGIIDLSAPIIAINAIPDSADTTPTISGSVQNVPAGTTVTLTLTDAAGNTQTITTQTLADGTWTADAINELVEGDFSVNAIVSDEAGNQSETLAQGTIDNTAPTITIDALADSNDTTPTISGTATGEPEGTVVTITVTDEAGNPQTITTEVLADGTFTVDVPDELSEGEYSVDVSITDTAGNVSTEVTTGTIDTSAPVITIDALADSNDTTPTISGTATGEPEGTVVTITVTDEAGNPQTITTEVLADGTFSVDVPNELSEGEFTIEVSVTDTAGNETTATTTGEVDTAAPTVIIDPVGDTNDTTPTISGTATGEPEGTVVTITVTDEAGNPQIITTEVQADGTFSVDVPNELSEGEFTVEVSVNDTAGNETTATTTDEVDTAAPTVIIDPVGDTNNPTPTISGTATGEPEGTLVTITVTDEAGNPQIITTEVQADGTFSVDVPNELSEGEFTVEVSVTDTSGNETTATTTGEVDTSAPVITIDALADSNDTTPTISGTATGEPEGTVVTITVTDEAGNPQTITTEVQADGTFSVDVPNELSEGEFTVEVSVTDTAGNETTATTTGEVDTTAPIVTINALGDTSDTTPTISGTVSGEPAGSTVTLTVTDANGELQTITAQVIADGSWTAEVSAALAEGSYSVDASISDSAGNEGTASASGTIDTSALTITIDIIGETNDQTPQINGDTFNAQAGSQVEVQITDSAGAIITLTTVVDENGLWSVTPPANLAEGTILISATVTDIGGGTANAELDAVIDITPPTIQVNELETSNDTTPVISGNTTDVASGTVINLTVTDSQGVVRTFSTTTDADGNWSVELSQELASGDYSVEAEVSDAAGNSASTTATGNIDTSGPSLTVDFEAVTNDSTPTISGTSDADVGTSITVVITDENGVEQTLSTTVGANGNWEVTPQTDLNEGDNTIEVSVSDEAGNTTTVTDTITLDTQAPILTIQNVGDVSDLTPELQGTSNEIGGTVTLTITDSQGAEQTFTTTVESDGHWNIEIPGALAQGDFSVVASITDAAGNDTTTNSSGNVDTITPVVTVDALGLGNDSTPVISGTSTEPTGTVINIVITDSNGDEHPITATVDANGDWQATSPELPDGGYTVQASITDAAGNTGGAVQSGTLDTLAPTLTLDTVGATNDSTPTISGSSNASAGTVINISVSDGTTTEMFTATVQADGSWSADVPNALTDGPLTIEASVSDNAGNTTTLSETAILNTTAPSISINALVDTNDTTPTINGTSDAADGTTISLTFEDSAGNITTVDTTVTGGVWSVDAPTDLAEGEYTVTAEVDDGLGNIGTATETGEIDLTGPSLVITNNGVGNDTTPTIAGTSDAPQGSEVTIVVTDSSGAAQTMSATVLANGTWSIPVPIALAEGAYTISASVEDAAGNDTTATGAGEIDTTAPTLVLTSPGSSNDITPTLSGTSDAVEGTVINFTVMDDQGNTQTFTTTVDADGNFSVEVPTALAEGPYTITANISDVAGNSTDITGNGTIDTTAPSVSVDAPVLTNDSTPTVAGTSDAPNSIITVTFTDAANATQSIDVQTDTNGNWSATPTGTLAEGNYNVSASITDAAGNTGTGTDTGEVDITPPDLAFTPTFLLGSLVLLNGTSDLPAGSEITITEQLVGGGVGVSYTTTTDANGNWSLTGIDISLLNLGSVIATATDAAGNTRTISSDDFDNTPPTLTVDVAAQSDSNTPIISGTSDAGEGAQVTIVVTDSAGNPQTITALVDANGDWSATPATPLSEGQSTIEVSVRDSVGNETTVSDTTTIDTQAPTLTIQNVGDVSDLTPELQGTSNEIGGTVTLTITDSEGINQTLSTVVGSDGHWAIEVSTALAQGDFSVVASITDAAGNESTANSSGNVDTITPIVTVDALGLGNDSTPVVSGTSTEPEGTVINIIITDSNGDEHPITATVDASGNWQATSPELPDGSYTVQASITDDAGNTGGAVQSGTLDTLAPILTLDTVGATNDSTPAISGTSNAPAGTVISISVSDGTTTEAFTATVQADGSWSADVPNELTDGPLTIEASVSDNAGNTTTLSETATLNTTAPSISINVLVDTNDTTPAINGTSDAADGTTISLTFEDSAGNITTVDTTVTGGVWSVDAPTDLAEGEYTVTAQVDDGLGNIGSATETGQIDLTGPSLVITNNGVGNDTTPTIAGSSDAPQGSTVTVIVTDSSGTPQTISATVLANGTWSIPVPAALAEGNFTVSASVSDTAGNEATATGTGEIDTTAPTLVLTSSGSSSDITPTLSGTSDAVEGTVINFTVVDDQGNTQIFTTTVDADGNFSIEVPTALAEGPYTITANISDVAGNSTDITGNGTIDTSAPSITVDAPVLTNDSTPTVTGTSDAPNSTITVTFTDAVNAVQTIDVQTDANGNWSATPTGTLAEGNYSVSASITDAAGNTGTGTDSGEVDVTPPTLAFTPTFELGLLVTLSGTSDLPAGSEITITEQLVNGGIGATYTTTTDADGNWSLVGLDVSLLDVGSVIATATDAAGNTRTISSDDFDNTPPTLTVDVATQSDSNTPIISGTSDAGEGAQVTIVVTDSAGNPQTITAFVDANGDWSATPATPLSEGQSTIEVSVRDSVGNETTVSDTTTIDTQAPLLTIQNVGDVSDLTPELQGTSNEIGGTVTLTVTDSDGVMQTITTTVESDGHWDIEIPSALAQGDFTVSASITDAAGNDTTASSSGNVDTITPVVTVDALGLGNYSTPVISGTSTEPEGTVVNIVITDSNGDEHPITATVDANGDWQATSLELPDGSYNVQASITDDAGNTGGATQTGSLDTLAPTLTLDTVGATNNSTPTISGTSNAPVGTVITINVTDANNTETFTATVQADGSWSADVPNALTDGPLTIEASVSDSAGNTTMLSEGATLDTNAPSINIDALMDTNDTTPNVSGTSSAANGTIITVSITDSNDITNTVQTTVTDGIWSVEAPVDLAEGSYEVEASVTDGSGNTSTATENGVVDTTIPNIAVNDVTVTDDTTPTITGTANAPQGSTVSVEITDSNNITHTVTTTLGVNGTWSVAATQVLAEGTFTVSASVSDAAGNEATATGAGEIDTIAPTLILTSPGSSNDVTPTLSGTSDAVEGTVITFTVVDDLGNTQTFTTTVDADGNFSIEVPTALAEGPYTITANISDVAGNSTDIASNGTIDTTAPSVSVDAPLLTNDSTPTVTGTSDAPNSTITVTFTDATNATQSIDVQTDASGNWSATPTGTLAEGNYSVSASITDAAGNTGTGTDTGEVDITPPDLAFTPTFLLGSLVLLNGTSDLPAGSEITITEQLVGGGVGVSYTTTTDANGNWSLTGIDISLLNLGSVIATATDAAGNTRTISSDDFDNTPPTLTVEVDAQSDSNTPIISGTSDAGEGAQVTIVVTDSNGNPQTITALVDANGDWSATPATPLSEGQSTIEVSVRDSVGNETTVSDTTTIDTQAATLTIQNVGDVSDLTPELQGTSNEIGGTVTLTITDSAGAVQTIDTIVDSDGHWVIEVSNALAQGDFTVVASITDAAGNESTANSSGNVDTITPVVTVDALGLSNDSTPVISGTSTEPAGTVINIVITDSNGDEHPITATVDANGDWQATSPELPDGSYTVQASITDDAGNTGGATQTGTLDTLAPTLTLDTVGATNDSTPTISGSSNAPAGTVINISVSDGTTTETFTATVKADGSWSADVPNALTDGPLTIEASVSDSAGNTTTLSEGATLDTNAPSINIDALMDTNDTTPNVSGTSSAENGTIITVSITDSNDITNTVQTTVTDGIWSVEAPVDLAEGSYEVEASVTDGSGNTSTATENGVVDTTIPNIAVNDVTVTDDTTPTITGTANAPQGSTVSVEITDSNNITHTVTTTLGVNGTWSVAATQVLAEGTFTVSASVSDAAGNEATATGTGEIDTIAPTLVLTSPGSSSDITPTLSGTSDAVEGTVINFTVVDDQGNTQTFTTTVDADGNFFIEVPTALAEGPYTITASISDAAGNSTGITGNGTIDTTAPSITVDAPVLTNDTTPTVTGTSDAPNSTITVTFTDAANATQSIDVQTDASGNWSATPSGDLAEGNYSVSASITDAAGNTGTGTDSGEVDITPPDLAFTPTFLLGSLVLLNGTSDLPAGSEITITEQLVGGGVGVSYTTTTDANGNWSLTGIDISLLNLGSVIATATDAAGNTRTISSDDFDNTPPTLTVDVAAQSDSNTPIISGTSDAGEGAQVTIVVTDSAGNPQTITALVDADGNWSATPTTPLSEGESTIEVSVRDSVGNETTASDTTTIDTQAPTLTIQNVGDVNDLTPTLQGTSNEIGGTVTLTITDSAGAVQTIDTIVDSDGHWVIEVSNALAQGDFTVVASITDAAGNESTANRSGNVDTVTPIVTVDALGLGNDSTPVVSGTSTEPEGTVINIIITDSNGDEHPITATVDANGDWQATSPELPDGSYTVQASITDDAGNTGGAVQSGNLDTLAPTLTLDTVGATNDSTPTVSGSSNAPAGTVINISVSEGTTTETFTATVQADGSWSADVPNALSDGELTIEASVSDNAGNTTTLSETATLNTTAPSISINALVDTNDTTPTINGTSDAADGTTISLTFEDSAGNITTVDTTVTGGVWIVDAPTDLAEGEYTVTATVNDGLGNIGSATETGQIDLTGPSLIITDNGVGNDTTPTIAGTSDAVQGSEITIVVTDSSGTPQTISATVLANGTWSIPVPVALAEGAYTISASVEDAAGNDTTATGTGEVDTTAPTLVLTSPGSSNDVTPTLSGTSDAVEGTVINFTVVDDLGNTQTFTTAVDADGNFSVEVPTALAEGPYTITANISDVAGNSTDITGNGTIDTSAPSITVDAPVLTNDSTPTVTGTSDAPSSTITVTFTDAANAVQTIDVQTDANGNWSVTPSGDLAEGNYSVSASITDAAGNTGTGTDTGEVDITAPDIEIIPSFLLGNLVSLSGDSDLPGGSVITITEYLVGGLVGATYTATTNPDGTWGLANITVPLLSLAYVTASASDAAGNVRTINTLDFDNVAPELTVSVDALSNDSTPVISGTTDMGQGTVIDVTVTDSAGQNQEFTAIVQAGGGWSAAVPAELAQGQYTVVAEVRDGVGNLTSKQVQGEIDSAAPSLSVNEVNSTTNTTPTISGTSDEIGADVTIIIGGQTLIATVGTDGNWQVDVPVALVDGDYTAQVSINDDANNISSTTIDLTIDTQVPVIVFNDITVFNTNTPIVSGTSTEPQNTVVDIVITDSNGDIHTLTAIVDASGDWQVTAPSLPDGNYDVEVSITDDAGNTGSDTGSSFIDTQAPSITINALGTINNSTPTISGTSNEPENTNITVTVTDGDSTETYTTVVGAGGAWSVDITDALTDGEVTVSASVTDAAGNESVANSTATLNTNAPTININTIVDTNDQTPEVSGTSSAADNTEITVVITDVNNISHTVTTMVVSGVWSVDATSILPEGEFTVSAIVTEGGLTSNATGEGVIDLAPPALNITPPVTSNDTTPTISGTTTAPQGALVIILITDNLGAEQTVNATVGANGTWSVAASTEVSEGTYTVSASTTDTAGNPVNTSTTGVVDITAPVVTINNIAGSTDLTPSISGSVTGANVGDAVAVVFTDAQGNEHTVNTTVQTGGIWSVEASSSLSQGDYSVEVFVTDSAGNTGDATDTATIDTIAPEISINQSSLILTQDSTPLITGTSNEENTNVIVTFTDSAGVSHQMTVQTDGNGDWQAAANNILADGVYSVSATISDAAGNTSVDNKTGGEVDTVGPELTIVPSFLLGRLVSLSGTSDLGEGKTVTVTLELAGDLLDLTYDVTTDANGDWELLGLAVNVIGLSVVEASATDEAGNTTTITTADVDASTPLLNAVVDFATGEGDLPIISGTTDQAPGTEVLVRVVDSENVVQELTAIVQADNTWAVQVPQSLAEGVFKVTVNVLSEVGITTTQLLTDVVDTISPTLGLEVIGTTSDSTPIIQGTSDLINGVVEIQLDGGSVLTTTVNAAGLFSLEVDALSEGQHVANVSITDNAGNVVTDTLEFVVDTLVPVVGILPLSISNTDLLEISGTSEEEPGTDIDVTVIGSNGEKTVFNTLIGSDGKWSLVTTSLSDGIYTVSASITDAAGNTGQSAIEQVTIDTIAPALGIDAFGVLNTLTPTIEGTSDEEVGSLITVNITDSTDTLYVVTTSVLGDGTWLIVTPLLAEGDLTIEAISTDDAGNITTVTQTGTISTTLPGLLINQIVDTSDTTPTITGTTDILAGDVQVVITDSSGTATTYNTQAIAGVWTLIPTTPLAEGAFTVSATVENLGLTSSTSLGGIIDLTPPTVEVNQLPVTNNPLPTITGISDAPAGTNVSVVITDANNDSQTITAQVAGNGTWSVTATTALSEGSFSATASISDTAGNSANDTMVSSTDYTAPTVVIDPILVGQDTTPTVTGSVIGSFAGQNVIVMFTDSAGATHNVQTTVGPDGTWSVTSTQVLPEGNYSVDVSIADSAGNTGTQSSSSAIDSGITIDSGLVLTTDQNPVITGTAAPGESVTVTFSGATEATETVFADASGEWSVTANTTLADGAYTVTAVATDSSGNATSSGSLSGLVIDNTPINFTVEPEYLLNLLGIGILVGYEGTSDGGEGSKVYIFDSLVLGIDLVLTSAPYAVVDAQGNWDSTNLDLNLLGLLGTGLENTHFYTVDEAGNYQVKNGNDVFIESGNIYDNGASAASGDTIPASFSEESALGDTTPNEVSSNNLLSTETIDLGNLSGLSAPEQTMQVSSAEPLNIDDVIINEDAEQLIALNTLIEDEGSAIAYTPAQSGGSIDAAASAVDVQNQSEEMIKHLIESSNNQTDI